MIGVLACTLQVMMMMMMIINNSSTKKNHTHSNTDPPLQQLSSILSTYSIAAGYLVFDQWYTFYMIHWCCNTTNTTTTTDVMNQKNHRRSTGNSREDSNHHHHTVISYTPPWSKVLQQQHSRHPQLTPPPLYYKSFYSVLEDAVTLIVILILLVQYQRTLMSDSHIIIIGGGGRNHQYQTSVSSSSSLSVWNMYNFYGLFIWPIYKLLRLMFGFRMMIRPTKDDTTTTTKELSVFQPPNQKPKHLRNQRPVSGSNQSKNDRHERLPNTSTTTTTTPKMIWRIYGHEYDLSNFVHEHPGGYEAIMLGCHREDCTALFRSYHPSPLSYRYATKVLQSYRIHSNKNDQDDDDHHNKRNPLLSITQENGDMTHTNSKPEDDEFYDLLCDRVATELWDRHQFHMVKDRTATPMRVAYYIFVTLGVLASAYNYGIRGTNILFGSIPFAIFGWLFGALGHDAGHFTVCRTYPIVNDICVWAMSLLCNPIVWQHQHTYGHHSHTNDVSHDPDLHHFTTLLRVHETFQHYNIYRYQKHPVYVFFAYMFVVFGTCIWIPFGIIQEGSLYGIVAWTDRHRPWRTIGLYTHLIAYTIFIVIVPFFVYTHWYMAWLAVTTHISLSGIIFAIFSQINHLNEPSLQKHCTEESNRGANSRPVYSEHDNKDKTRSIGNGKDSWSLQQIKASNNFCPQSVLWYYLSNGLNLQIEHHLFPGLNHCHLPRIQPIVQDMCRQHGVRYKCYDSWYDIMMATLEWLDRLSELSFPNVSSP